MTQVIVTQQAVQVAVTPQGQPAVLLSVPAPPIVLVQSVGLQGPPGPLATLGDVDLGTFN